MKDWKDTAVLLFLCVVLGLAAMILEDILVR